jgi:hypothetical protein
VKEGQGQRAMMEFRNRMTRAFGAGKLQGWSSSTLATVLTSSSKAMHYGSVNLGTLLVGTVAGLISLPCRAVLRRCSFPVIRPSEARRLWVHKPLEITIAWCAHIVLSQQHNVGVFLFASLNHVALPQAKSAEDDPQVPAFRAWCSEVYFSGSSISAD